MQLGKQGINPIFQIATEERCPFRDIAELSEWCLINQVIRWRIICCLMLLTVNAFSQAFPIDEQFQSSLSNAIWSKYLNESDLQIYNNKLYYTTGTESNGDNDAVLICKIPLSLSKSWVSEFWINTGSTPVRKTNAFKKAGFIIVNATNTNQVLSLKAYDEGVDGTSKIPYARYENSFPPIKTEGQNQLLLYPWQSNSWYPTNVKATASWCASTKVLKVKMTDPNNQIQDFQIGAMEIGDPFYDATDIVIGIIMKCSYQACGLADNFYISRIKIAEGYDLSVMTSANLSDPISLWQTSTTIPQPAYNSRGFYKLSLPTK